MLGYTDFKFKYQMQTLRQDFVWFLFRLVISVENIINLTSMGFHKNGGINYSILTTGLNVRSFKTNLTADVYNYSKTINYRLFKET